MHASVTC